VQLEFYDTLKHNLSRQNKHRNGLAGNFSQLFIGWFLGISACLLFDSYVSYAFLFRLPPIPTSIVIHLSHWLWCLYL